MLNKMERRLSRVEVEEILRGIGNFRIDPQSNTIVDEYTFECLRAPLRDVLYKTSVVDDPEIVAQLKKIVHEKYLLSLVTPGISEGSRAASANIEPLTQSVLKAMQSAGLKTGGDVVNEMLSVSDSRGAEFVFTTLGESKPIEWHINNFAENVVPPDIDDLIEYASNLTIAQLDPMIVRNQRGAVSTTVELVAPEFPDGVRTGIWRAVTEVIYPGQRYLFNVIKFSMAETLKARRTPFQILDAVRNADRDAYSKNAEISVVLYEIGHEDYKIAIWSPSDTNGYVVAQSIPDCRSGEGCVLGYELIQIPTTKAITECIEVDTKLFGYLAPKRPDGAVPRTWRLTLGNINAMIPAGHVACFLRYLGLQVFGASRNAAGRCNMIRVAEYSATVTGDLMKWISMQNGDGSIVENEYLTTWRMKKPDQMARYSMYRTLKLRTNKASLQHFLTQELCREVTYTNVLPEMTRCMCTHVARQAMEFEWLQKVAGSKVPQSYVDYVTMYTCGTGPLLQAVNQKAIRIGGPLAAMNENPKDILTEAALTSKIFTTNGSQSELVTGTPSRQTGATSVMVTEAQVDRETLDSGVNPSLRRRKVRIVS